MTVSAGERVVRWDAPAPSRRGPKGRGLAAPPWLRYEAVNVLHQCVRWGWIRADRSLASLHELWELPVVYLEASDLRTVPSLTWAPSSGGPLRTTRRTSRGRMPCAP